MNPYPDFDAVVEAENSDPLLKEPQLFDVILLNDDYTTMEFVIEVLMVFFQKSFATAESMTNEIHHKGSATVATYPRDIAETKVDQVIRYAQSCEFPLRCTMQPN